MESLRGKLLLASPRMTDPNFEKAVILMIQHDDQGALGLVLNQPTDTTVAEVIEQQTDTDCNTQEKLYRGGPCEGPLMVLHADPVHAQEHVADGLYFATEREHVQPALSGTIRPARFFAGYSGWGAGQLETELTAKAWSIVEADPQTVLVSNGLEVADLWRKLIRVKSSGELFKHWNPKIVPRDPSMN